MNNIRITYQGKVESGKLHIYRSKDFVKEIQVFDGKKVEITVRKKRTHRSLMQNAYYWGVIVPLVQQGLNDVGYKVGKDQTHEYLKGTFHIVELVNEETGEILKSVGTTTNMTTTEMMEYFEEIKQWATEYLNIYIPDPNEQIKIEIN